MSEMHEDELRTDRARAVEELARAQHAVPVDDPDELAADIWESDEELDAFLTDLRSSRDAFLA